MPTTYVNYKVMDKSSIIFQDMNASCYADITYTCLPETTTHIITFPTIKNVPYKQEQVKKWIEVISGMGFTCKFLETDKTYHYIQIDIKNENEQFYLEKLHLTSTLILIRYLWEDGLNFIPKHYFTLKKRFPNEDDFDLVQMAHIYNDGYGNTNHSIRDFEPKKFITKQALFNKMKDYSIYERMYPSVSSAWNGARVVNINKKRYKETLNKLK